MKKLSAKLSSLTKNSFLINNFIVLCGSLVAGFVNYLYNFSMARMLTPVSYAELASLIALFYFLSVPSSAVQLAISRFSAEMRAKNENEKLNYFLVRTIRYFLILGIIGFFLFLAVTPFLRSFLNLTSLIPLIWLGILMIILFINPIGQGALQGEQNFLTLSLSGLISSIFKLLIAIFLVWMGMGVNGAIIAIAIATLISIIYVYRKLKLSVPTRKFPIDRSRIVKYSQTVVIATFLITALSNLDIILIKHFWDPVDSANYSILSLMGKIIFFITGTIPLVMFPRVVDNFSKKIPHLNIIGYSLKIILAITFVMAVFYFAAGKTILDLLFGNKYDIIAPYLGFMAIIMGLLSIINFFTTYNLATNQNRWIWPQFFVIVLEAILIYLYHDNVWQIICNILIIMLISLVFFLLTTKYESSNNGFHTQ